MPYKFRGYPCNCASNKVLHAVGGLLTAHNSEGGGVLEWCVGREDAESMIRTMRNYPEFSGLRIVKWAEKS